MSFRAAVAGRRVEFICCWMISRAAAAAIIVFLEILASCNCRLVSPSFLIIIRFLRSDNLPYPAPVSDTVNLLNLLYCPTKMLNIYIRILSSSLCFQWKILFNPFNLFSVMIFNCYTNVFLSCLYEMINSCAV